MITNKYSKKTSNFNRRKKVVVSGYYGFDNFGDEAVLEVLLSNIKDFDVTVFSSNPVNTSKIFGVKSVRSFNIFEVIKKLFETDILISGGGSLLQDVTSLKSLVYYLFVIYTALLLHKKVIIFAQGIGPIKNGFLKLLTFFALKKCEYISVRDEKSLNILLKENIPAKRVCDPVWNFDFPILPKEHNSLGIQLRYVKETNEKFLDDLAKAVIKNFNDFKIYLIPLQPSDNKTLEIFEEKLKQSGKTDIVKIEYNNSSREFAQIPGQLEYFIAMRFHACLGAIKSATNVLPIIYDPKVETLADEYKLSLRLALNDTNIENIISNFKSQKFSGYSEKIPTFDFSEILQVLKN